MVETYYSRCENAYGKTITLNSRLCSECAEIYGLEPNEWPEWLRWMLSDIQRDVQNIPNDHVVSIETGVTYDSFGVQKAKSPNSLYADAELNRTSTKTAIIIRSITCQHRK